MNKKKSQISHCLTKNDKLLCKFHTNKKKSRKIMPVEFNML